MLKIFLNKDWDLFFNLLYWLACMLVCFILYFSNSYYFSFFYFFPPLKCKFWKICFGWIFFILQMFEYYEAFFNISDSVYSSAFYMLTGLHGFHVIVGASFLTVCFIRLIKRHYTTSHYLGFIFAVWYWHFVDAVWILLFLSVYCWGSW